jgi:hypothetical protein
MHRAIFEMVSGFDSGGKWFVNCYRDRHEPWLERESGEKNFGNSLMAARRRYMAVTAHTFPHAGGAPWIFCYSSTAVARSQMRHRRTDALGKHILCTTELLKRGGRIG